MLMVTKRFPCDALESIALDSVPEVFFCGDQSHAGRNGISHPAYQHEVQRVADLDLNVIEYPGVVGGIQQTLLAFKR